MLLDDSIWQSLVKAETDYEQARWYFFKHSSSVLNTLRKALHTPTERETALKLIKYINTEDHKDLLYDLIEEASVGHSDIQLCRETILSLLKEWLIENIEVPIQKVLINGGDEEYRRLIELCTLIDNNLVEKLSKQALTHSNEDIKEVGKDFQEYLSSPLQPREVYYNGEYIILSEAQYKRFQCALKDSRNKDYD